MGGNRMLLVVVLIILLVVVGGLGIWWFMKGGGGEPEVTEFTPEVTPENVTEIVVAVQNIPRGMQIREEDNAIELQPWPNDYLPMEGEYFTALEDVNGKFARMDIPRGMPVLRNMVGQAGGMLSVAGSAAALFSPSDRVAYAIPMDTQGGVAWAIRPGDHVDVIAAIKLQPVDPEFQTPLPNQFFALPRSKDETFLSGSYGRFETLPNGQPGLIFPSGEPMPTLIVQLTVQDAIVWHVGVWENVGEMTIGGATPAEVPPPTSEAAAEGGEGGGGVGGLLGGGGGTAETTTALPVMEYRDVEPVTLLVKREDALVLKYLLEMQADLDLVLRPAGFTDIVIQPQPVWLRYVMDRYQLPTQVSDLPVAPVPVRPEPLQLIPQVTEEPVQ